MRNHGWLHRQADPAPEVPVVGAAWWDGLPADAPSIAPVIHATRAADLLGTATTAQAA